MPDKQPNISSWSAAELMRYATGRMSSAEMHALEKAALEDTFLAEALEGYMEAMATQSAAMVQAQADRLEPVAKKKEAPVVPLWQRRSVQIAVAALFIAGGGWAVFSLLQKPAAPAIVQQTPAPLPPTLTGADTNATLAASEAAPLTLSADDSTNTPFDLVAKNKALASPAKPAATPAPATVAMAQAIEPANSFSVTTTPYSLQKAAERTDSTMAMQDVAVADAETMARQSKSEAGLAMKRMQVPEHVFKGRITDAKNNPVPYANVMIDGQDFGTYSDVSGQFNFLSEDSVLPIRVRSVGFTNQTIAINSSRPETKIILQEDQQLNNSLPLTVQSRSRAAKSLQKSIVERDSISGLEASNIKIPYYDLYLLNNNRISPLPTLNRQVELSFDISKSGEATNITVVKSSGGKTLDEEAIRLVKEGPKLNTEAKSKAKKKVTVRF